MWTNFGRRTRPLDGFLDGLFLIGRTFELTDVDVDVDWLKWSESFDRIVWPNRTNDRRQKFDRQKDLFDRQNDLFDRLNDSFDRSGMSEILTQCFCFCWLTQCYCWSKWSEAEIIVARLDSLGRKIKNRKSTSNSLFSLQIWR